LPKNTAVSDPQIPATLGLRLTQSARLTTSWGVSRIRFQRNLPAILGHGPAHLGLMRIKAMRSTLGSKNSPW
jgi:hypothetical protein